MTDISSLNSVCQRHIAASFLKCFLIVLFLGTAFPPNSNVKASTDFFGVDGDSIRGENQESNLCADGELMRICVPADYMKYELPQDSQATHVSIGVDIKDIPKVNDKDFSITLNAYFIVKWRDDRLIVIKRNRSARFTQVSHKSERKDFVVRSFYTYFLCLGSIETDSKRRLAKVCSHHSNDAAAAAAVLRLFFVDDDDNRETERGRRSECCGPHRRQLANFTQPLVARCGDT